MKITQERSSTGQGTEYLYWIGDEPATLDEVATHLGLPEDWHDAQSAEATVAAHTPDGTEVEDVVAQALEERLMRVTVLWDGEDNTTDVDWANGHWVSAVAAHMWENCPRSIREVDLDAARVFVTGEYSHPTFVVRGGF
ncbi:MAG: hypothetical protein CMF11_02255 [Idiomarina sp.]|nr:hypothetical protein [Idiomarina sp.]